MTQELRPANTDWDSEVGFFAPTSHAVWGKVGSLATGHDQRAMLTTPQMGAIRRSQKEAEEEKNPQKSTLKTRKRHYQLAQIIFGCPQSACSQTLWFSPWRPCLGASALAARAGRSEGRMRAAAPGWLRSHFETERNPLCSSNRWSIRSRLGCPGSHQAGNRFDSICCLLLLLQPDHNCFTVIFPSLKWKSTKGEQASLLRGAQPLYNI